MARASMGALVARARLLIGDPSSASQTYSDDEIEEALDRHREEVRYLPLTEAPVFGDATEYFDYHAPMGDWEADEKLLGASYQELWDGATNVPEDTVTADRTVGKWTFEASQEPPVLLVGKTYDVYSAAADLLDSWPEGSGGDYDITIGGDTYRRSQKNQSRQGKAALYRSRARVKTLEAERSDWSA